MPCLEFQQKNSQYLMSPSVFLLSMIQGTPIHPLRKGSRGKQPI